MGFFYIEIKCFILKLDLKGVGVMVECDIVVFFFFGVYKFFLIDLYWLMGFCEIKFLFKIINKNVDFFLVFCYYWLIFIFCGWVI